MTITVEKAVKCGDCGGVVDMENPVDRRMKAGSEQTLYRCKTCGCLHRKDCHDGMIPLLNDHGGKFFLEPNNVLRESFP